MMNNRQLHKLFSYLDILRHIAKYILPSHPDRLIKRITATNQQWTHAANGFLTRPGLAILGLDIQKATV